MENKTTRLEKGPHELEPRLYKEVCARVSNCLYKQGDLGVCDRDGCDYWKVYLKRGIWTSPYNKDFVVSKRAGQDEEFLKGQEVAARLNDYESEIKRLREEVADLTERRKHESKH